MSTENKNTPPDEVALQRLLACEPVWVDVAAASEAFAFPARTVLHAGPPVSAEGPCAPIENSAVVAVLFEGWAADEASARAMVQSGEVVLRPAQDYNAVVPLASVLSPSMMVQVVEDKHRPDNKAFSPINGGSGPALRLGLSGPDVLRHLQWLNGEFANAIRKTAQSNLPLLGLANQGLLGGDDCHGRTPAATAILAQQIVADNAASSSKQLVDSFLKEGPSFFLNLWMAAARCMLNAASGVPGSSMVTSIGGNGRETGIQVSGIPGRWFTVTATAPKGGLSDGFVEADCLGAIGDSAVVDTLGLGAMSLANVPEQLKTLQAYMPDGWRELANTLMPEIHPAFNAFDVHVGLTALRVVEAGMTPAISLGVIHKQGESGRIGGGIYCSPVDPFEAALKQVQSGM